MERQQDTVDDRSFAKTERLNDAGIFTLGDVLEHLDGMGLVVTDEDIINEGLKEMGLTVESEVV